MTPGRLATAWLGGVALCVALLAGCGGSGAVTAAPDVDADGSWPDPPQTPALRRAARGAELYVTDGCFACHSTDGSPGTGPTFRGLAGSTVGLTGGRRVKATRGYLIRAIADPSADVVRGYSSRSMSRAVTHLRLPGRPGDVEALAEFITMIGP